jgi:hypothetical protein
MYHAEGQWQNLLPPVELERYFLAVPSGGELKLHALLPCGMAEMACIV